MFIQLVLYFDYSFVILEYIFCITIFLHEVIYVKIIGIGDIMKQFDVLGINLKVHTIREALALTNVYLSNDFLNTVNILTIDKLVKAVDDEQYKVLLEQSDLNIMGQNEILSYLDDINNVKLKNFDNTEYLNEFFKRCEKMKKVVYLLCEKEHDIQINATYLADNYENVEICGSYALENLEGDFDIILNHINVFCPDVVLTILPSPEQEQMIFDNKQKINAKLWLSLQNNINYYNGLKVSLLHKLIEKSIFRRKVIQYKNDKE